MNVGERLDLLLCPLQRLFLDPRRATTLRIKDGSVHLYWITHNQRQRVNLGVRLIFKLKVDSLTTGDLPQLLDLGVAELLLGDRKCLNQTFSRRKSRPRKFRHKQLLIAFNRFSLLVILHI